MADLPESLGEVLMGSGGDEVPVRRKQHIAHRWLRNVVCVLSARLARLLAYMKVDPDRSISCLGSPGM
ncbi:hypothetical protein [Streptomyces sp. NPDC059256]|uniref:hypothetical protein n=1 Tax=Streptomyces sp. NPDC059256 TaxID=3346794 RepID=UPI0036AC91D3